MDGNPYHFLLYQILKLCIFLKNTVRGARPKISKRHATFRFKMETPIGEKITAAEFRIYKEQLLRKNAISWENSTYQIKLFQVRSVGVLCCTNNDDNDDIEDDNVDDGDDGNDGDDGKDDDNNDDDDDMTSSATVDDLRTEATTTATAMRMSFSKYEFALL